MPMEDLSEGGGEKIIQELITHLNQLESRISSLDETISEASDLQLINKLDIINLKNELDKIHLVFPSITQEQIDRIQAVSGMIDSDSVSQIREAGKKLDMFAKTLKSLSQRVQGLESSGPREGSQDLDSIRQEIEIIKKSRSFAAPKKTTDLADSKRLNDLEESIANLRLDLDSLGKPIKAEGLESIKSRLDSIESTISSLEGSEKFDSLKKRISTLEGFSKPGKSKNSDSGNSFSILSARIDSLEKSVSSSKKPMPSIDLDPIERRVSSLEKLKNDINSAGSRLSSIEKGLSKKSGSDLPSIESRLSAMEGQCSVHDASPKLSALEKSVKSLQSQLSSLEIPETGQLEKRFSSIERTIHSFPQVEKRISSMESKSLEPYRKELSSLQSRLSSLEKFLEKRFSAIENSHPKPAKQKADLGPIMKRLSAIESRSKSTQKPHPDSRPLVSRIEKAVQKAQEIEGEIRKLKSQVSHSRPPFNLEARLDILASELASAKSLIIKQEKTNAAISSEMSKMKRLSSSVHSLKKEIETLKSQGKKRSDETLRHVLKNLRRAVD